MRSSRRTWPLLVAVALLASPLLAQQQRTASEYAELLEGAERVARMQVPRVIEQLGLAPGMRVADIGSGSGLFTRPIAQAIDPDGIAYAVDIDGGLLELVERSARAARITNIRTILSDVDDPKLPEPVDVVLICDTLHHIANPGPYLKTLVQYVKPGGTIAIIDFSENWAQGHESMQYNREQFDGWVADAGFTRVSSHDYLENSYFVILRR